jgi:hypothetical protein
LALLGLAYRSHHLVDQRRREATCQDAESDVIGEALIIGWLYPPGPRHGTENNTVVTLTEHYWA